tara:strand:+ start:2617 stop:3024 length:408 start_codon:yes stop_codon:yes gene_type:complete
MTDPSNQHAVIDSHEVRRALRWFSDYTRHLELAIPMFVAGDGPDESWRERSIELDAMLRDLDPDSLRAAAFSDDGTARRELLQEVQVRFEKALHSRLSELGEMMSTARRGQRGLLGYARTGNMSRSSALYIERQL